MDIETASKHIFERISDDKPFMLCRFGETELRAVADAIGIKLGVKKKADQERLKRLNINAGVFPYGQEMELKFAELMCKLIPEADIIGAWNTFMQDYIISEYVKPSAELTVLRGLEPYYSENPWSKALEGKKVLVVHPFTKTIEAQYKKRDKLFENKDVLPEFELKTETIAGQKDERFKDWFEALDYMYERCMNTDFDVAVIGCGAYGFPLAAKLKKAGKKACI